MTATTVFVNNRSQAVRLPAQARFPASVKRVQVRVVGADRVISPVEQAWQSSLRCDIRPVYRHSMA